MKNPFVLVLEWFGFARRVQPKQPISQEDLRQALEEIQKPGASSSGRSRKDSPSREARAL